MIDSINWLAVLVATVVSFVSGFIWFGPKTFYPIWWKAIGKSSTEEPGSNQNMAMVFGSITVALFIQALTLFIIVDWYQAKVGEFGIIQGLTAGLIVGIGVVAASPLSHRLMSGHGFKVWLIEVGNDVLNFALMGAIFGLFL
ncbi:MAG: DUF1761 domain-containing protein [Candidatus Nanopelagicales bacterium]